MIKPACVYAYEANLDDMNRKRLAEWRKRRGEKKRSPFNWYENGRNKIILNDKLIEARKFINNIEGKK